MEFSMSPHAITRAAQRNVTMEEVEFVLKHGHRMHRAGGVFCQLRDIDLPDFIPPNSAESRLVGTTVLLCRCGHHVLTLYRNPKAFKKDGKKQKYGLYRSEPCPSCANRVAC